MKTSLREATRHEKLLQSHKRTKSYREYLRLQEISRNNSSMLDKIQRIQNRSKIKTRPKLVHRSLNGVSRMKERNRIGAENEHLRRRIINAKSVCDHRSHLKEFEGFEQRKKMINNRRRAKFGTSPFGT